MGSQYEEEEEEAEESIQRGGREGGGREGRRGLPQKLWPRLPRKSFHHPLFAQRQQEEKVFLIHYRSETETERERERERERA